MSLLEVTKLPKVMKLQKIRKCHNCKSIEHPTNECVLPRKQNRGSCRNCKSTEHRGNMCPNRTNKPIKIKHVIEVDENVSGHKNRECPNKIYTKETNNINTNIEIERSAELYLQMKKNEADSLYSQAKLLAENTEKEISVKKAEFEAEIKNGTIIDMVCCICFINTKNIVLAPCNHLCVCHECILDLFKYQRVPTCPICRSTIIKYNKIYS